MTTSLILIVIAGLGALLFVMSFETTSAKDNLERMERLRRSSEELQIPEDASFLQTAQKGGLALALARWDLNVTPASFIRDSALVALVAFAIGYFVGNGIIVAVFACVAGIFLYFYYLSYRSVSRRIEYEAALATICDRIATGAMLTQTLQGAINHAAENAPEILKADFQYISAQLMQDANVDVAFADAIKRRKSYALNLLANSLSLYYTRGAAIPLRDVIQPLSSSIKKRRADGKKMHAELTQARLTAIIATLAVPCIVLLFRMMMPNLSIVYSSLEGQLIQIGGYTISTLGFLASQRTIQSVQKIMEVGSK